MDSRCPSPSTHIPDGTYSAKKVVVVTKKCCEPPLPSFDGNPPRPPDRHASGRTRPLDPQCGSVTVPTPLPTAHGVHPTISVASRSPVEGEPDQLPHFPAQPRARWSRGRAPIQSTFDPVCGRLWAVATFTRPASRAVRALWPAPRSPGLAGPQLWPRGRNCQRFFPPAASSVHRGEQTTPPPR